MHFETSSARDHVLFVSWVAVLFWTEIKLLFAGQDSSTRARRLAGSVASVAVLAAASVALMAAEKDKLCRSLCKGVVNGSPRTRNSTWNGMFVALAVCCILEVSSEWRRPLFWM